MGKNGVVVRLNYPPTLQKERKKQPKTASEFKPKRAQKTARNPQNLHKKGRKI
jgi:hypothetical protein